jgi:hypothetical protein
LSSLVLGGGVDDCLPQLAFGHALVEILQGCEGGAVAALADGVRGLASQLRVLTRVAHNPGEERGLAADLTEPED